MRQLFLLFALFFASSGFSQKIIGSAMADDNGLTDKEKDAKFLIVEKQLNDSTFQRLDYYFAGPMISNSSFKDKDLKILNGVYADYHINGYLATTGQYVNNKKDGDWFVYDDTSKVIIKYSFHLDSLISTIDMDSLDKANKLIKRDTTGEIEAKYQGGNRKVPSIISANFKVPDRTAALINGGNVRIRFAIDTTGKACEIYVFKSVEFAFDEEALRVVGLLNNWKPASDKGKKVKAYRIQPISINLR